MSINTYCNAVFVEDYYFFPFFKLIFTPAQAHILLVGTALPGDYCKTQEN